MPTHKHKTHHISFTPANPSTLSLQYFQSTRKNIINALQRGIRRIHRHSSPEASVYVGYGGMFWQGYNYVSICSSPTLTSCVDS